MKTCEACGHRPASIEFIQVTGDERRKMALCRECALSVGMRAQVEAFQRLSQLLIQQQDPLNNVPDDLKPALGVQCSNCGLAFGEFVQTGLLGCPQCYTDFHNYLQPVLRRMHGVTRQTDDNQAAASEPAETPATEPEALIESGDSREHLEMELHLALLGEDYEKAAALRDRLKKL